MLTTMLSPILLKMVLLIPNIFTFPCKISPNTKNNNKKNMTPNTDSPDSDVPDADYDDAYYPLSLRHFQNT